MPDVATAFLADIQHGFGGLITHRARSEASVAAPPGNARLSSAWNTRSDTASIRIGVAQSPAQLEAAAALVRRRYSWRGYDVGAPHEDGHRPPEAATFEITFVAENDDATFGTITLGLDGPRGLRADDTHADVVDSMRASGRRVCELTRLAVATSPLSRNVLASLFSLAYATGRTIHGATDVFIEVNPRHVGFYSRLLGFVAAAGERFCERVRAPSVLLHLELDALEARLQSLALQMIAEPFLAEAA